jgi:hypothetical protein
MVYYKCITIQSNFNSTNVPSIDTSNWEICDNVIKSTLSISYSNPSGLSQATLGGIIGGAVGAAALLAILSLLCCPCFNCIPNCFSGGRRRLYNLFKMLINVGSMLSSEGSFRSIDSNLNLTDTPPEDGEPIPITVEPMTQTDTPTDPVQAQEERPITTSEPPPSSSAPIQDQGGPSGSSVPPPTNHVQPPARNPRPTRPFIGSAHGAVGVAGSITGEANMAPTGTIDTVSGTLAGTREQAVGASNFSSNPFLQNDFRNRTNTLANPDPEEGMIQPPNTPQGPQPQPPNTPQEVRQDVKGSSAATGSANKAPKAPGGPSGRQGYRPAGSGYGPGGSYNPFTEYRTGGPGIVNNSSIKLTNKNKSCT